MCVALPYTRTENGQTPGSQPLKENWVRSQLHCCQKPSTVENYTSAFLSQILGVKKNF